MVHTVTSSGCFTLFLNPWELIDDTLGDIAGVDTSGDAGVYAPRDTGVHTIGSIGAVTLGYMGKI